MSFKRVRFLPEPRQARGQKRGLRDKLSPQRLPMKNKKGEVMASKERIRELLRKKAKGDIGFWESAELDEALSRNKGRIKVIKAPKKSAPNDISKVANALNNISYANSFDRKAFVHFEKTAPSSKRHNLREYESPEKEPDYFMPKEFRKENEFWELKDEKGKVITPKALFNKELEKYGKGGRGKGKRPKFENSDKEALIVLNESHSLDDLLRVKDALEKFLNITCYRIAIHRDEGHFRKDGTPCINYHAHLNFITIKDKRQNFRVTYTKHKFGAVQSMVAKLLNMQRGEANSNRPNLRHKEYKAFINAQENAKEIQKAIKRANKKTSKKAVQTATAELKAQLKALKTPKFSRTLAYQHLKRKIYPDLNEKFDKLGIDKENSIRKHLFGLIADFAKNFDTQKIDFEKFNEQIKRYETAIFTQLERQQQQENAQIIALQSEKEKLQKDLDTTNAENKALKEKITSAPEAQPTKAAEPEKSAAAEIPPQNENNAPKIENNVETQEIPQEREKVENSREKSEIEVLIDKLNAEMLDFKKKASIYDPSARNKIFKELNKKCLKINEMADEIELNANDNSYELKWKANGCINKFRDFEKEISNKYGLTR